MSGQNLLVIVSDEHQGRAMGCAGHPFVQTPHLDALAARGTRFTQGYTPSPICVPARAAFATGRHVHTIRNWDNAMPYTGETPGWGHALQAQGTRVESVGKLHYRAEEDPTGFDALHLPMMVAGGVGMVWASLRREHEQLRRPGRMLGPHIGPGESSYTRYDASVVERAQSWLADHATSNEPWCLYVGLVAPHFPLVAPQDFYDLYPTKDLPEVKLHPRNGHLRHPWVEKQNAFMDSEAKFTSEEERLSAMAAYYGLTSWLDHNVGEILGTLDHLNLTDETTVIYTSDHGDNVGARGLWGKSNLYEESVHVPMIAVGPRFEEGICETPVSLLDLSAEIADHFGTEFEHDPQAKPLSAVAAQDPEPNRQILSQYHAAGSVSGAFMLREGRWKYNHYVGFAPELFDLENDPEELSDLAQDAEYANVLADMEAKLRAHLSPEEVDAQAFADQDALIARVGGPERALALGASGATPPPGAK